MAQVSLGETPEPDTLHEGFVYLSLQELATRISHRNTGLQIGDPVGYEVMRKVCSDENLHQLFYRDLAAAAFEVDPDAMMIALEKQVRTFTMPGTGIPDFERHAALIAKAGIYDLQIHHEQILAPVVLRQWGADTIEGLSGEGAAAQERLMKRMARAARRSHGATPTSVLLRANGTPSCRRSDQHGRAGRRMRRRASISGCGRYG